MSIFSSFKKGKKVADQKKTQVEATKQATTTKPIEEYRHVIAHAARDAVIGAPSGWKDRDRHAIKNINSKRNSMMSRESSYVGQSGFPRSQSFNSDASNSQYHRSQGQRQMQGRTVRSTSYLNDQSSSRMSMPHRLETRHHSYQGRFGYAANGAYVGAAQPFMPSPLATSRNSPTEESGPEVSGGAPSDTGKSTSSSSQDFEMGDAIEMPVHRHMQAPPPEQEHPAYRNSKRKYRESAPAAPAQASEDKAQFVVSAKEMAPDVTEIHAPTPRRYTAQHDFILPVSGPAGQSQQEPAPLAQENALPYSQQMTRQYSARQQAAPAPAPSNAYAFDHAPMAPAASTVNTTATAAPPPKKARWSFQRFKRNSAVAAH